MSKHDSDLAAAFDHRAAEFERAPVQSNPEKLARLVKAANLPAGGRVFDGGCGPGLVGEALLKAGYRVHGVDLSAEMIGRARQRCAAYGERATFERMSLFDGALTGPFDGAISRFVLHHTPDPVAFLRRQVELLRPGGVLAACDHTTDPDAERAEWHQRIECYRDRTHTRNPTPGQLLDWMAAAGLTDLQLIEEPLVLDFDEWFDRGTPAEEKETVRRLLLSGSSARGFHPRPMEGGAVRIEGWIALARGVKPAS